MRKKVKIVGFDVHVSGRGECLPERAVRYLREDTNHINDFLDERHIRRMHGDKSPYTWRMSRMITSSCLTAKSTNKVERVEVPDKLTQSLLFLVS
jgi:hypothetical protein